MPKSFKRYYRRKYRNFKRKRGGNSKHPYKTIYRKWGYPGFKKAPKWNTTVAPRVFKIKMKYHKHVQLDQTQVETAVMRGNSVFDPDESIGGEQPVNYDDIAPLYNEYCVLGSKIKAEFRNVSAIETPKVFIKADFLNSFNPLAYDPYAQKDTIVKVLGTSSGGKDAVTLKMYRSTSKLFGRPVMYDPNFSSATGTNPISQWYWIYGAYTEDPTSVLSVSCDVTVTYYVVFRKVFTRMAYD